jgi:hypothetical protein
MGVLTVVLVAAGVVLATFAALHAYASGRSGTSTGRTPMNEPDAERHDRRGEFVVSRAGERRGTTGSYTVDKRLNHPIESLSVPTAQRSHPGGRRFESG